MLARKIFFTAKKGKYNRFFLTNFNRTNFSPRLKLRLFFGSPENPKNRARSASEREHGNRKWKVKNFWEVYTEVDTELSTEAKHPLSDKGRVSHLIFPWKLFIPATVSTVATRAIWYQAGWSWKRTSTITCRIWCFKSGKKRNVKRRTSFRISVRLQCGAVSSIWHPVFQLE